MEEKNKFEASEIGDLVIAGAKHAWAEKEPVALIGLLLGAINVALFWPVVEMGFTAMQGAGSTDPAVTEAFVEEIAQKVLSLWPLYLLMMLVSTAVMVILARLATEGRGGTLAGGIQAFVTRLMWVSWRFLGMLGWILLGVGVLWLAGMVIGLVLALVLSLFGAGGGSGSLAGGPTTLIMILFMFPALVGILFLYGALGLSLISECADHRLTIRRAWTLMKGKRIKIAVALIVIYLAVAMMNGMLMTAAPKQAGGLENFRLTVTALHVVVTVIGTFATFAWFSMTAKVAGEIDWSEPAPAGD